MASGLIPSISPLSAFSMTADMMSSIPHRPRRFSSIRKGFSALTYTGMMLAPWAFKPSVWVKRVLAASSEPTWKPNFAYSSRLYETLGTSKSLVVPWYTTLGVPSALTTLLSPKNRLNSGVSGAWRRLKRMSLVSPNSPVLPVADLTWLASKTARFFLPPSNTWNESKPKAFKESWTLALSMYVQSPFSRRVDSSSAVL